MDDVPVNLKSSDVTNVQEVLSLIVTSFPTSFAEITKWIELRGQTGPEIKVFLGSIIFTLQVYDFFQDSYISKCYYTSSYGFP